MHLGDKQNDELKSMWSEPSWRLNLVGRNALHNHTEKYNIKSIPADRDTEYPDHR